MRAYEGPEQARTDRDGLHGRAEQRQPDGESSHLADRLNRLESASQNVTLKTLGQLCRALRCELGDLFRPGTVRLRSKRLVKAIRR